MSMPQPRGNLKRRDCLTDLNVDGIIIFKWISKLQGSRTRTIFNTHCPCFVYRIMKIRVAESTGNFWPSEHLSASQRLFKLFFLVHVKPGDSRFRNRCPNLKSCCAIMSSYLACEHVSASPRCPLCQSDLTCDITGNTFIFCAHH
jgi:hypothetical protein